MYRWNEEKNEILLSQRGVSFNDVLYELENNGIIDNYKHPDKNKYPNQYIYVVSLKDYIHYVPYIKEDDYRFLKNIIPSRKLNKKYKGA
jgi:uncharacterized DUF497 family protein